MISKVFFVLFLGLSPSYVYAVRASVTGGQLTVSDRGEVRTYMLPRSVEESSYYAIRIKPSKESIFSKNSMGGGPTHGSSQGASLGAKDSKGNPLPSNLSSLLFRANKLFQKKKFEEAMSVLDHAENIAPQNHKVKAMKGSLFYLMGWKEMAREHWESSLKINPKQTKVQQYLERLGPRPASVETPSSEEKSAFSGGNESL